MRGASLEYAGKGADKNSKLNRIFRERFEFLGVPAKVPKRNRLKVQREKNYFGAVFREAKRTGLAAPVNKLNLLRSKKMRSNINLLILHRDP